MLRTNIQYALPEAQFAAIDILKREVNLSLEEPVNNTIRFADFEIFPRRWTLFSLKNCKELAYW